LLLARRPRLASKDAGAGKARYGGVIDTRLHKSKIASPPWAGRWTRNDVEDVSVLFEGNATWSRHGLLMLVEDNGCFGMWPKQNS